MVYPFNLSIRLRIICKIKMICVPFLACRVCQNKDVNLFSLFETRFFRKPCSMKIYFMNFLATVTTSLVVFLGIKWATLVIFSTITKNDSWWNFIFGISTIKSILIDCHFWEGISSVCNLHARCLCLVFTF